MFVVIVTVGRVAIGNSCRVMAIIIISSSTVLHWQINGSHQIHNGCTNSTNSSRMVDEAKLAADMMVYHIRTNSLLEISLLPNGMLAMIGI